MNKQDKINGAQIQLDNMEHYRPLTEPMVQEIHNRVLQLINELHDYNHIDEMTKKWLGRHQIRLEYQFFTPSLKYISRPQTVSYFRNVPFSFAL